jgi:peptidoglycan/LPS O-acetylase OafA/YrhL
MTNKDYALSLIRFVSTVLILSCHTCEWIGFTLGKSNSLGILGNYCSVGVQVFLILSGYLYGARSGLFDVESRQAFIFGNFKKILLVYYVYVILIIIPVYYLLQPGTIGIYSIWNLLTCSGTIWGVHHLWFIPYILTCYIITPLLYDFKLLVLKKNWHLFHFMCILVVVMLLVEIIGRAFGSYFIGAWINCYIFGFFLPNMASQLKKKGQYWVAVALAVLSTFGNLYTLYVRYQLLPDYQSGLKYELCTYFINYSRVLFALTIFCVLLLIGKLLINKSNIIQRILDFSDKYSYDIYIVHMIYVKGILSLLDFTNSYIFNVILMLITTIVSAYILNTICSYIRRIMRKEKYKVSSLM